MIPSSLIKLLWVAVGFYLITTSSAYTQPLNENERHPLLIDGKAYRDEYNFKGAISCYENLITKDNYEVKAYEEMAKTYCEWAMFSKERGELEDAEKYALKAIENAEEATEIASISYSYKSSFHREFLDETINCALIGLSSKNESLIKRLRRIGLEKAQYLFLSKYYLDRYNDNNNNQPDDLSRCKINLRKLRKLIRKENNFDKSLNIGFVLEAIVLAFDVKPSNISSFLQSLNHIYKHNNKIADWLLNWFVLYQYVKDKDSDPKSETMIKIV